MPLYEHRRGGHATERVRPVRHGFEDTRLGLMATDRTGDDGWHAVPDVPAPEAADADRAVERPDKPRKPRG